MWAEARKVSRKIGVEWELHPDGARITTNGTSLSPQTPIQDHEDAVWPPEGEL